ncbi:alcohol dehydrogenase [Amycolatopsis sp. A1MSW2902]|uniref:NDMA-dependent alcohol dehydrogenase n=1 Tax=Amycolatopsis sp. A1MSW2902 TaxID=687413 RepID=UPI00307F7AC6
MKTRAAVVDQDATEFEVRTLEVAEPGPGEVHVKFVASGLCHSDLHLVDGVLPGRKPVVAGHEGAGIVESVGPGVTRVAEGDHVVCSFMPSCGVCRYCATGRSSLCDWGANSIDGTFPDGKFRYRGDDGREYGSIAMLGTFSERATVSERSVVKVDDWLPLEVAVLVGCGVPTGWGTATVAGGVHVGDTAVVYGIGGIGINSIQGAAYAGAKFVVAVDPVEFKRETALKLGATHAFATAEEAAEKVNELTWGQGADQALVTVGVVDEKVVQQAFDVVGKGGTVVVTGLGAPEDLTVHVSGAVLTKYEKTIKGSMFGTLNPQYDIVKLLRLYDAGRLKLDELATRHYRLDEINQGYADLRAGEIIRGVILHDH